MTAAAKIQIAEQVAKHLCIDKADQWAWDKTTPAHTIAAFADVATSPWHLEVLYGFVWAMFNSDTATVHPGLIDAAEDTATLMAWLQADTHRHNFVEMAEREYQIISRGLSFTELLHKAQILEIRELCQRFDECVDNLI